MNLLLRILLDERGTTLAITRKTANTLITASGFNTNYAEIEAVVNALTGDNFADDAITAAKLNADVVRTNYGLVQHSDGSLYVKTYGLINVSSNGVAWGRTGDMLLSSSVVTPDGFTDVSATYADKFIRISATALATGGANTHTHAVGSYTADSHTLTTAEMPAHTHSYNNSNAPANVADGGSSRSTGDSAGTTGSAGSGGGHTHTISGTSASGDNVPAYVSLKMYQHS